ncbi:peroxisomal membrane protein PMP47B [Nadsonia fulvescens var. elongata DSM 6958]|uniref:Peroxisomal membrane protein PMP47B n=1 Tax=Nadsonia fulvescens var. elongata DSM 6958 TaxID=857566 RepID=A0A1E3PMD2_9ASCO|nr:peroxisomal membrane protein PMP47B [Nadsonia fulvescens var. elongata DSM 6958]
MSSSQGDNIAHALSGAGGGALSMFLTYPLITLSTRAQTESIRASKETESELPKTYAEAAAAGHLPPQKKISTLQAAKHIIKREGVAGLYSGWESALVGISLSNFIYYYFYEASKGIITDIHSRKGRSPTLSTLEAMLAGAIAGSATVLSTNPIWVVNTRMTVKDEDIHGAIKKRSVIKTILNIIQHDGFKAFLSGIGPSLVLVLNPIIQYSVFEKLKTILEKKRKMTAFDAFFLGAIGKLVATGLTYPYITLKSRQQVRRKKNEHGEEIKESTFTGIYKIIKSEGISALYKGIDSKLTQSIITAAFLFFFKEKLYYASLVLSHQTRKLSSSRS